MSLTTEVLSQRRFLLLAVFVAPVLFLLACLRVDFDGEVVVRVPRLACEVDGVVREAVDLAA